MTFTGSHQLLAGQAVVEPPLVNLWGWWAADDAYTETSGTPTTKITTDGTAIGSLLDKSGAGRHMYQTAQSQKPIYKTGIISNRPIARLATASSQYMHTNTSVLPDIPISIYIVFNPTTWANLQALCSTNISNPEFLVNQSGSTPQIRPYSEGYGAVPAAVSATLGSDHLVGTTFDAARNMAIILNDGTEQTSTGGDAGPSTGDSEVQFGANTGNNGYFDGDIAEMLIYSVEHALGSGDGLDVRKYLNRKYGLQLPL